MPGFSVSSEFNSLGLEHTAWSEEPVLGTLVLSFLGTLVLSFLLVHVVYFLQKDWRRVLSIAKRSAGRNREEERLKGIPGGGG